MIKHIWVLGIENDHHFVPPLLFLTKLALELCIPLNKVIPIIYIFS